MVGHETGGKQPQQSARGLRGAADGTVAGTGATSRRILLIGGAGYVGLPLTSYLLGRGYQVTTLDLLVYRQGALSLSHEANPDFRMVVGDMGDEAALDDALQGVTDVVLLAGLVGDPVTKKFPSESHAINDLAVTKCIDALNGRGLDRVIFISTCSNYGLVEGDALVTEESPLAPLSLYAKSKVQAERHLLSLKGRVDYRPTILRFATAFGLSPRMRFDLTVNEFVRQLNLGEELVVYDGHTWRPYCHVKDFARLIDLVFRAPAEDVGFEVFNAGGERNNHTKKSIVDAILSFIPRGKVSYRANSTDPRNYRVDFSKVRGRLGFEPQYAIEDGIDEIIWAMTAGMLDEDRTFGSLYRNDSLPGLSRSVPQRALPRLVG